MRTQLNRRRGAGSSILDLRPPPPPRPPLPRARLLLLPLFVLSSAAFALSLFLPWHHRFLFGTQDYASVTGREQETWVVAGSAFALLLAALFARRLPRAGTKVFALFTDAVMLVAVIIDYLDWQMYAASVNPNVTTLLYLGPGFYLALGGTGLLIAGTVLVWRQL